MSGIHKQEKLSPGEMENKCIYPVHEQSHDATKAFDTLKSSEGF